MMNRTLSVPLTALIAAVFALSLGACQGPNADRAASTSATAAPTVAPTAAASTPEAPAVPHGIPDSAFVQHKPFNGPAVARYGQKTLQVAYKEMVNFAFATGWNSVLIARSAQYLSRADLAFAATYLTPTARKDLMASFAKVLQGDKTATNKLEEAIFFGVVGPNGLKAVQTGKVVTNRKFTEGAVGLDSSHGTRLLMSFAAKGDIQMVTPAGAHQVLRTSRVLQYLLVPNSGADRETRPFLIDSWKIKMNVNAPVSLGP